jgi:hypothetical protein
MSVFFLNSWAESDCARTRPGVSDLFFMRSTTRAKDAQGWVLAWVCVADGGTSACAARLSWARALQQTDAILGAWLTHCIRRQLLRPLTRLSSLQMT